MWACLGEGPAGRPRGVVLLLCTVLVTSILLAVSLLLVNSRGARVMAGGWVLGVSADLLARSGVERARMEAASGREMAYGGEDLNGNGTLDAGPETGGQVFLPARLNVLDCPLVHAQRPSFFARSRTGTGLPEVTGIDGRLRGFSGRLRAARVDDPGLRGNTYALRVVHREGIWLNAGELDTAGMTPGTYDEMLHRMLGTLAEALDREDLVNDAIPVDQRDGERLVEMRPAGGWTSWGEIEASIGAEKAAALRPYVVLRAWTDRKVIRPNAVAGMVGMRPRTWAQIKMAHDAHPGVVGNQTLPDFERARPEPGSVIVGRAPVYLGWARERPPVLLALLAGLRGVYLDESEAVCEMQAAFPARTTTDWIGRLGRVEIRLDWSAPDDNCRRIARAIGSTRRPLETWEEWASFCDRLIHEDLNANGVLDRTEDQDGDGGLDPYSIEDLDRDGVLDINEDLDGDGHLDRHEDTNGNGVLDSEDLDGDGHMDVPEDVDWDGHLDTHEDLDGNGVLDPGEDVDGDGWLDVDEDLDGDGRLDTAQEDANGDGSLSEDSDGDGHLDVYEDVDGDGKMDRNEDLNGDGRLEPPEDRDGDTKLHPGEDWNRDGRLNRDEDLNGNGRLDAGEDTDGNGVLDFSPLRGTDFYLLQAMVDLLKANFNPNSDLNKFGPAPPLARSIDKSDLLAWSTEFSLFPTGGIEIASLGRVVDAAGALVASRQVETLLAGPRIVRLTTQREFLCGNLGNPDIAGDAPEAGSMRSPGDPNFVSEGQDVIRTWCHAWDIPGWRADRADNVNHGASLQAYPGPYVLQGGSRLPLAVDYDGYLQLATVETQPDANLRMLARFDDDFNLESPAASPAMLPDPSGKMAAGPLLRNDLLDPSRPGTLLPDGCYSECERTPAWLTRVNGMNGFHGVLSFWVKPNYRRVPRIKAFTRGRRWIQMTNYSEDYDSVNYALGWFSTNQFLAVADGPNQPEADLPQDPGLGYQRGLFRYHFQTESSHVGISGSRGGDDPQYEGQLNHAGSPGIQDHRWQLLTCGWDFEREPELDSSRFSINGMPPKTQDQYWIGSVRREPVEDLALPGIYGEHRLALGTQQQREWQVEYFLGRGADATFDEVGIWDFGGEPGINATAEWAAMDAHAAERYQDGRFYPGRRYRDAYDAPLDGEAPSYVSAVISLGAGAVVRAVHWTWLRPTPDSREYAGVELLDPSGAGYLWTPEESCTTWRAGGWDPGRQSWRVGRAIPTGLAGLRLRVVFRNDVPSPLPLLDTPILDDLTLLYAPPGGCGVEEWTETSSVER